MSVNTVDTRPVTPAQAQYLNDLRQEFVRLSAMLLANNVTLPVVERSQPPRNCSEASRSISKGRSVVSQLRVLARNLPVQAQAASATSPVTPVVAQTVTEGMWIVGDFGFHSNYQIFKVQHAVHGSGRLYAKRLDDNGTFIHAPGAVRMLAYKGRKMTLKEAKEYGALYGTCVRCGRTLTDENSISAGIGPICAEKFA